MNATVGVLAIVYEEMCQAMVAKDRQRLERCLSEDFVLIHMTGMRQNREEFIRAVEDGILNYFSAMTEYTFLEGDALVGQSKVRAAVFGGGEHTWRLQQKCSYTNKTGEWQVCRSIASTY